MTVAELIAELQALDPETPVITSDGRDEGYELLEPPLQLATFRWRTMPFGSKIIEWPLQIVEARQGRPWPPVDGFKGLFLR